MSECRAQPTNYEHFQINGDTILHVSMPYSFRILVSWKCSLKTIPCIKNVQNVQIFRQEAPLSSKKIVVRAFGSESHACLASEFLRLTSFCMFFSSTSAYWKEYVEHYYAAEGGIDKMRLLDRRSLFYTKYCFFLSAQWSCVAIVDHSLVASRNNDALSEVKVSKPEIRWKQSRAK